PSMARAQTTPGDIIYVLYGLKICRGEYALCEASTCTPDGKTIEVNVAGKGQVWSLYWPRKNVPQAINNWSRKPAEAAVQKHICSSNDGVGASFDNCFSFACTVDKKRTNGVKTATCLCPLGENLDGQPVAPNTAVLT